MVEEIDLGTHIQFVADVVADVVLTEKPSMTYAYYQSNVKPKPVGSNKKIYVCSVCVG